MRLLPFTAAGVKARLTQHDQLRLSGIARMMDLPRRYAVTITVHRGGGFRTRPSLLLRPSFAAAARAASVVSAHTASQIVSIVLVRAVD